MNKHLPTTMPGNPSRHLSRRTLTIVAALVVVISGQACQLQFNEQEYNRMADAIKRTEGVWTYGIKSIPVTTEAQARRICINTIRNQTKRWDKRGCFLDSLADRYCPPSCDPQGNKNWKRNMRLILKHQCQ